MNTLQHNQNGKFATQIPARYKNPHSIAKPDQSAVNLPDRFVPDGSTGKPYARPLSEVVADLSQAIPNEYLATRKQGGIQLTYIPWHHALTLLDQFAPGWRWEIKMLLETDERLVLTGRLTIPTAEGEVWREASGQELLNCGSYGDPSSNAESMAFRRAASKFGLGLYLYRKE